MCFFVFVFSLAWKLACVGKVGDFVETGLGGYWILLSLWVRQRKCGAAHPFFGVNLIFSNK